MAETAQLLRPGTFFGGIERQVTTTSFAFSEMVAERPEREVPRHTHLHAHCVLVLRGTYLTEARNRPGLCGPGTFVFNPAGTTHRDRFQTPLGKFFTISVSSEIAAAMERAQHTSSSVASQIVTDVVRKAYGEFRRRGDGAGLILEGLGLELAGRIAEWREHPDRRAPRWLQMARESLRDRCTDNLTIRQIAAEARVHPIHLARTFRQFFRCSPGEYLRRCRLEKVQQLLLHTGHSLSEVSLLAGFADQSHLAHAFKRSCGMTPGEFRRNFRS